MASFGSITANWGGNVAGLPKPGAVPKPPSGIAAAGTGLLKGLAPAKPKAPTFGGISAAGSAATNLAGQLTQGGPTAAATGGGNAPSPASTTGGASGPPLDATAQNDIAQYLFKTNNAIAGYGSDITNDQVAQQAALGTLAYNQPRDALSLEQKANAGGGLYSSVEQQNQGNLAQKFLTQQNAVTQKYGNDIQGLQTKIGQLQATEDPNSPTMMAYTIASGQRAIQNATNNPSYGTSTPAATNPLMTPVPGATPLQQWQSVAQILGAPTPTQAPGPQAATPSATPGTITTHPGGSFYSYYKAATGQNPPATLQTSNPIYRAWQSGTPAKFATLGR